jgi:predicted O-methyltransferase YrrM
MNTPTTAQFLTFDEAWELTKTIPQPNAFSQAEGRAYYETLMKLPQASTVLEIGCEHGRSTSLLAQAARQKHHQIILIDPFVDFSQESFDSCMTMMRHADVPFTLHHMRTADVPEWGIPPLDFAHIDGDHSAQGVKIDCWRILPHVRTGGYALFHDYIHPKLPWIKGIVDSYTDCPPWEIIGTTERLRIVRRRG